MRYLVASLALLVSGFATGAIASEKPPVESLSLVAEEAPDPRQPDQQEIDQLKQRIGELQNELDRLKNRLKSLENKAKPRMLTIPAPSHRPLIHPIPPDWHRREFNGQEYFIIPLAKAPAPSTN